MTIFAVGGFPSAPYCLKVTKGNGLYVYRKFEMIGYPVLKFKSIGHNLQSASDWSRSSKFPRLKNNVVSIFL